MANALVPAITTPELVGNGDLDLTYYVVYDWPTGSDLTLLTTRVVASDAALDIRTKIVTDVKTYGTSIGLTLSNGDVVSPRFERGLTV